jgi:hypothetical protein
MRSIVTFNRAAEESPSDDAIPGKPFAVHMAEVVQARGIESAFIGLHDTYAWCWMSRLRGAQLYVVLGLRDGADDEWLLFFVPRFKIAAWLSGSRYSAAMTALASGIDEILHQEPAISNIRWHDADAFDAGDESSGNPHP